MTTSPSSEVRCRRCGHSEWDHRYERRAGEAYPVSHQQCGFIVSPEGLFWVARYCLCPAFISPAEEVGK